MEPSLTQPECLQIAQKDFGKNATLINYHIKPVSDEKRGFLGEYFTLELQVKDERKAKVSKTYFIKIPPPETEDQQDDTRKIFAKETALYRGILSDFSKYSKTKWKPECFLARDDILVLEDLTAAGYRGLLKGVEPRADHMKLLLANLAAMHASSIAYELDVGKTIGSQLGDKLFETSILKDLDWFRAGVMGFQAVLSAHPKYQSSVHQKFIQDNFLKVVEPVYGMVNESARFKNVLCHRDTWMNNVLFLSKDENLEHPTKAILVDFQFCRYCPPAIDVTLAIYLNTSPSTRSEVVTACLEWYHRQLTTELDALDIQVAEHISFEALLESYSHLKLVSLLYVGAVATWVRLPSGFLEELQNNDPEKYVKYRTGCRREILLELIGKDEKFRKYMFDVAEDFMKVVYKK